MTISFSSPITGAAVTGLTSPTYTLVADVAPVVYAKQYAVTALGGTQTGVDVHLASKPFTFTFFRPASLRTLPSVNPITGVLGAVPRNVYKLVVRKGAAPLANQNPLVMYCTISLDIPAGIDVYEPEDIRALVSSAAGAFWANASDISQSLLTGLI